MANVIRIPDQPEAPETGAEAVLRSLAASVLVVDKDNIVTRVNTAAEDMFQASASHLVGRNLEELIPNDSPLFGLIAQVRNTGGLISRHQLSLGTPKIPDHMVNAHATPLADQPGSVVITLLERSITDKLDKQLSHRSAARTVTALSAMLAHEVKNPLSGIRGAAQLLEQTVEDKDQSLTRLIMEETDRINALVDRMAVFHDQRPLERGPVNIHEVLEHVRRLAEAGFGKNIHFVENYDPSLPPVFGVRDQLIQVLLNLVKNACEASPQKDAEVILSTAYHHGARLAIAGAGGRVHLPLVISVQDFGEGIPEDLKPHLFDAFVTSKPKGSGLGLALVAKIVGDHGGVIEYDSDGGGTIFRVRLPVFTRSEDEEGE